MPVNANGVKKSDFSALTSVPSGATLDFVSGSTNYKITFSNFLSSLGVTGTIVQEGNGTPVLDIDGAVNRIRNIENGNGIIASVGASNSLVLSHNFTQDGTGTAIVSDIGTASPTFRSLVAGTGISLNTANDAITITSGAEGFYQKQTVVRQASDLSGTLDSDTLYFIDADIDFSGSGVSIEIPAGGLSIRGHGYEISSLSCGDNNYSLFTSPAGGSGNLILQGLSISTTGVNGQVYNLTDATGNSAVEVRSVNYNGCSSLGTITGYRQGQEFDTGRFGGTPALTLAGAWAGGYRASTTIVRGISNSMSGALFRAGAAFVMQGRFLTDINADLGTTANLLDFAPSNFPNSSTLQIKGAIIQRGGVFDATDATISPNITEKSISSDWTGNVGIENTNPGGRVTITATATTTISATSTFVDLAGTFTADSLDHFDNPAGSQLRHLGNSIRDFRVDVIAEIVGTATDVLELKIVKWDDSASSFVDVASQRRVVISVLGSSDVALFSISAATTLDVNDYVKLQIANNTSTDNVTAQLDDIMFVSAR